MRPSAAWALRGLLAEGPLRVRISGACMSPWLVDGSQAVLERAGRVWPGDVVAFRTRDGALVAHRVLVALPGRVYTQADHESMPDGAFPPARLVGRLDVPVGAADRLRALLRFGRLAIRGLSRLLP